MNEENDVIPEMPDSIQQQRQETYENSTLFDSSAEDELNTVLTAMKALPFGGERQKDAFFENVQRLQTPRQNALRTRCIFTSCQCSPIENYWQE